MPGNQGIPDRYNAEKILRDIRFLRLKLLDNDQSALCAALFVLFSFRWDTGLLPASPKGVVLSPSVPLAASVT